MQGVRAVPQSQRVSSGLEGSQVVGVAGIPTVEHQMATSQLFSAKALIDQPHLQKTAYNVRTTGFLILLCTTYCSQMLRIGKRSMTNG